MSKLSDELLTVSNAQEALKSFTLRQPLRSLALRRAFLDNLFELNIKWDLDNRQAVDAALETFFPRYDSLCTLAIKRERSTETVTHWELLDIIHILTDQSKTRHELEELIRAKRGLQPLDILDQTMSPDGIPALIDLAASSWLLVSIGDYPGVLMHVEPILWHDNDSFSAGVIQKHFPRRFESSDIVKLPQTFTAAQLELIGGIKIWWTHDLVEHLLLKNDETRLMLFHPVSELELHVRSSSSSSSHASLLPSDLVQETIRTIALLIPPVLGEPNPWFQAELRRHRIDAAAGICDRLNSSQRQIDKFVYWRDRLVLLKRTLDDAEPKNLSQLWHDDRKKTQWFTFWVAVLVFVMTLFFGVVQSTAGIVQAWASVEALRAQG